MKSIHLHIIMSLLLLLTEITGCKWQLAWRVIDFTPCNALLHLTVHLYTAMHCSTQLYTTVHCLVRLLQSNENHGSGPRIRSHAQFNNPLAVLPRDQHHAAAADCQSLAVGPCGNRDHLQYWSTFKRRAGFTSARRHSHSCTCPLTTAAYTCISWWMIYFSQTAESLDINKSVHSATWQQCVLFLWHIRI